MEHSFDIDIATNYGIECAILLKHLYYWVEKNRLNDMNFHDGDYWTFNTKKAFKEQFKYFSERQIDYTLKKLEGYGLIKTGCYNKNVCDRTKWYTLTKLGYSILQNCQIEKTKLLNASDKIVSPIPNINTNINTNINEDRDSKKENIIKERNDETIEVVSEIDQMFNEFWKVYPKKVDPKGSYRAFKNVKGIKKIFPTLMQALEIQSHTKQWQNKQFIPNPTTWLHQERWKDENIDIDNKAIINHIPTGDF